MPTPYEIWIQQTRVDYSRRGGKLEAVDKAVQELTSLTTRWRTGAEGQALYLVKRLKAAFEDWQADNPNWRTSARNRRAALGARGFLERYYDDVCQVVPGPAKHQKYKVPHTPHVVGGRRVPYHYQSRMMNCWWASTKMVLDYHVGEKTRRRIMENAPAAKRIYQANSGIRWNTEDGIASMRELRLKEVTLRNQTATWFSTEDIMLGLQQHGPLLFSGAFVRMFNIRSYEYGHVIVVYGVEYDVVWYHDPQHGLAAFEASNHLKWKTFSNYRNAADRPLTVHAVDREAVARVKAVVDLEAHTASLVQQGMISESGAREIMERTNRRIP